MTRMSKKAKRRAISPRKPTKFSEKSGPKQQNGFRAHENALDGNLTTFIAKIK